VCAWLENCNSDKGSTFERGALYPSSLCVPGLGAKLHSRSLWVLCSARTPRRQSFECTPWLSPHGQPAGHWYCTEVTTPSVLWVVLGSRPQDACERGWHVWPIVSDTGRFVVGANTLHHEVNPIGLCGSSSLWRLLYFGAVLRRSQPYAVQQVSAYFVHPSIAKGHLFGTS